MTPYSPNADTAAAMQQADRQHQHRGASVILIFASMKSIKSFDEQVVEMDLVQARDGRDANLNVPAPTYR